MGFFSDVIDAVTKPLAPIASAVGDAFDVVKKIPGFEQASGAIVDFARTPTGMVVFRALSTSLYGPLAWSIGPQVASIAFALPGIARGDDFLHAYINELSWRTEQTAQALGGGEAGKQLAGAAWGQLEGVTKDLTARLGTEGAALLQRALYDVASDYIAREDVAYYALKAIYQAKGLANDFAARFGRVKFDPATGDLVATTGSERLARVGAGSYAAARGDTTASVAQVIARLAAEQDRAAAIASTVAAAPAKKDHDLLLAIVVLGAAGAFAYWHRREFRP